eukprot:TRINITY_DN1055_c0_g1_i2.p1 TRINITY_DN1055_c0_g1~~TRINITY_DN1055_c0_g1_i2.p1  ORF type:complete len:945 (+),score=357.49 TRINITY_DN1055_c0_g1_i2:2378-5212(+)
MTENSSKKREEKAFDEKLLSDKEAFRLAFEEFGGKERMKGEDGEENISPRSMLKNSNLSQSSVNLLNDPSLSIHSIQSPSSSLSNSQMDLSFDESSLSNSLSNELESEVPKRKMSATLPIEFSNRNSASFSMNSSSELEEADDIVKERRDQLQRKMNRKDKSKESKKAPKRNSFDDSKLNELIRKSAYSREIFDKLLEKSKVDNGNPTIGMHLLLLINQELQQKLYHLVRFPNLILENLIMLEELELAKEILNNYPELRDNNLLLYYSKRALQPKLHSHSPPQGSEGDWHESFKFSSNLNGGEFSIKTSGQKFEVNWNYSGHLDQIFSGDEEKDQSIRSNHLFTSGGYNLNLALKILNLAKPRKYGQNLIDLCDSISSEDESSFQDSNVNSTYKKETEMTLVNIMSKLLNLSRNFFLNNQTLSDHHKVSLCDSYLYDIELIQSLHNAKINTRFSLIDLTDKNKVRSLRDTLIDQEAFDIAFFVCSQYNLEQEPVWTAWGLKLIKSGEYSQAREKLRYSFSSMRNRNSNDNLLKDILAALGFSPQDQLMHSLENVQNLSSPSFSGSGIFSILPEKLGRRNSQIKKEEETKKEIDETKFKECLGYLIDYSTNTNTLRFLLQYGKYEEVFKFGMIEKKVPPKKFAEILVSRLNPLNIEEITSAIYEVDPQLQGDNEYLFVICNYLNGNNDLKSLLRFQLIMKDWARAGLTCIKIYVGTSDFSTRKQMLEESKSYFKKTNEDRNQTRNSPLSEEDVNRYLKRINVQNAILDLLGDVETNCQISLFGSVPQRCQIAEVLFLSNQLDMAVSVLSTFQLPTCRIIEAATNAAIQTKQLKLSKDILKRSKPLVTEEEWNELVKKVIQQLVTNNFQKEAEDLIPKIRGEGQRIEGFIICGKLKSAYLLAVKTADITRVAYIRDEAKAKNYITELRLAEQYLALMSGSPSDEYN